MIHADLPERPQVEMARVPGSDTMAHVKDEIFQVSDILHYFITLGFTARLVIEAFDLGGFGIGHSDDLLVRVAFSFLEELGDAQ
jgi:hypothetical protein